MAVTPDLSGVDLRLSRPVYRYHQYQGDTNDCGPTSVAIAVNAMLGRAELEGPTVAEEMSHLAFQWTPVPHPVVQRIPKWATFPWGIVYYLRKRGFRARWHPFGTLKRLERNLSADRLTMVMMGEPWRWEKDGYTGWAHVKILFGQLPGRGFLFVDPGFPRSANADRLEHYGLFWQDEETFLRQWRNLLRIFIEVEEDWEDEP
jgi:hypothetical protein